MPGILVGVRQCLIRKSGRLRGSICKCGSKAPDGPTGWVHNEIVCAEVSGVRGLFSRRTRTGRRAKFEYGSCFQNQTSPNRKATRCA